MNSNSISDDYNRSERFVTIPSFLNLKESKINYLDTLIYTALKSFNSQYADISWFSPQKLYGDGCYPSYETIAKQAGVAKGTVIDAVERLEAAKYITVTRANKLKVVNHYWFPDFDQSFTIPFALFRVHDLSPHEKAMLIIIRQFYIGIDLNCMFSNVIKDIAKHLGLTYKMVNRQYNKLVEKGYLIDHEEIYNKSYRRRVVKLSDKLRWIFSAKTKPKKDDFFTYDEGGNLVGWIWA